jgi:hypothetical protein
MRHCFLCGAVFLGLTALAVAEPPGAAVKSIQPVPGAPVVVAPEPVPVVKLAVEVGAPKTRALKYTLLPDPLDLTPGNAAHLWNRAGVRASAIERDLNQGPNKVIAPVGTPLNPEGKVVPLKDLPRKEIHAYLAYFAMPLRVADQAARCDHCDWESPPLKLQELQDLDLHLSDIQHLRKIAALLQTRCMLELSESRFDDAIVTLQTGFAMARDIGKGDTLIQDLVGIAIGGIMFGQVEQWEQVPGSPNLFWALTDLPRPLVNTAPAMRNELTTIFRSFPPLRQLIRDSDKGPMSEEEANKIASELVKIWSDLEGSHLSDWQKKLAVAATAIKIYPDAKKYLLAHGRTPAQVDAMPALQVVLLYEVEEYDQIKDELLKWMNVAPWEARAGMYTVFKDIKAEGVPGNILVRLLIPAVEKVYDARIRIERTADYLRCAEALRMYAATHDGKAPEKLEDVKLPLPLDSATGQGFGKFYKVEADGTAVLEIPPPPPIALPSFGRRFELTPKH